MSWRPGRATLQPPPVIPCPGGGLQPQRLQEAGPAPHRSRRTWSGRRSTLLADDERSPREAAPIVPRRPLYTLLDQRPGQRTSWIRQTAYVRREVRLRATRSLRLRAIPTDRVGAALRQDRGQREGNDGQEPGHVSCTGPAFDRPGHSGDRTPRCTLLVALWCRLVIAVHGDHSRDNTDIAFHLNPATTR